MFIKSTRPAKDLIMSDYIIITYGVNNRTKRRIQGIEENG